MTIAAIPRGEPRLALDKSASARRVDPTSGHLHVTQTPISKANVCPYAGSEIPDFERLGLDPKRIYQLLRDPAELEKAVPGFDGKPLLIVHKPVSAEDHARELTVGAIHNPTWSPPYVRADLVVWDGEGIEGIENETQRQLSSGYFYDADMTPGEYEGEKYDGRMVNIRPNHVALVEEGRAGPDVMVGDSAHISQEALNMATRAKGLSRQALLASGALSVYLKAKLAQDTKIDLTKIVAGVTAANWKVRKPAIKAALDTATRNKLAADADLEDVIEMLDQLDTVTDDVVVDDPAPDDTDSALDDDGDMLARVKKFLEGKLSPEDMKALETMMKPEVDPTPPAAQDTPPPTPGTPKPPAADAEKEPGVPKAAMDAAITAAVRTAERTTIARLNAIRTAEREVEPHIGKLEVAMDSAEAVYKLALDAADVDLTGVPPAAYGAMVRMLRVPGSEPQSKPTMASDAAAAGEFKKLFPTAPRIRHLA